MLKEETKWINEEIAAFKALLRANGHEFLERIYLYILSRPIDPGGLSTYSEMMTRGCSKLEIIDNLLSSSEFKSKIKGAKKLPQSKLPPRKFVHEAYQKVLWREPDAEGFEHYVSVALSPDAYAEIVNTFTTSDEGRRINARKVVLKLSQKLYRRHRRYNLARVAWICRARSHLARWSGNEFLAEMHEIVCQYGRAVLKETEDTVTLDRPASNAVSEFGTRVKQRVYAEWGDPVKQLPEEVRIIYEQYLERNPFSDLLCEADSQTVDPMKLYRESCYRQNVYGFFG